MDIVWTPGEEAVAAANLTAFLRRYGVGTYAELTASVAVDVRPFYAAIVEELGLRWDRPYRELLHLDRGKPFARWFEGGMFNAAAHCLLHADSLDAVRRGSVSGSANDSLRALQGGERRESDKHAVIASANHAVLGSERSKQIALTHVREAGGVERMTFAELRDEVGRLANALRSLGVRKGDTVGIFMPLIAQSVVALLAIGYVGAIAVPAFSGYGEQALAARLDDAGVKVVLTVDVGMRRGNIVPMKAILDKAKASVKSLEHVLVYRGKGSRGKGSEVAMDARYDHCWEEITSRQRTRCSYEPTSANDPYMLLYTSGSTGKPKGTVHTHGGFPIKVMIDQHLCFDVKAGDRMLWYTDMGWMMGPFLVLGALGLGASIVLYDGTPDYPTPDRLWKICEEQSVTHLGVAPTVVRSLAAHGDAYPRGCDLSALRILGSSGEPWNTEPYLWFLRTVGGGRAPIINYSGGTEIGGGIVSSVPTLPLTPNCFHGPCPGMSADVVDSVSGLPVRGSVGELVIRQPFVGMTQSFWKNARERDDARYFAAYWERMPGLWVHGDWAEVRPAAAGADTGVQVDAGTSVDAGVPEFWYIRGRSDDTMNIAGKRVGPAEFESAVVGDPDVVECAAIGVPDAIKGDAVVLLIVAKNREVEGDELRVRLLSVLDAALGKALRPKEMLFVGELPKTRNGKVMRRVARARYLGDEQLGDLSALENPGALLALDEAR